MPSYAVAQGHMETPVCHTTVRDRRTVMPDWIDNIKPAGDKIAEETNTWNRNKLSKTASRIDYWSPRLVFEN